jgi:hypothetical protein
MVVRTRIGFYEYMSTVRTSLKSNQQQQKSTATRRRRRGLLSTAATLLAAAVRGYEAGARLGRQP